MRKNIFSILSRTIKTILSYLIITKCSFVSYLLPELSLNIATSIDIALTIAIIEIISLIIIQPITKTSAKIYYPLNDTSKMTLKETELGSIQVDITCNGKIEPNQNIFLIFPKWLDITTPHYPEVTRHSTNSSVYIIKIDEFGSKTFKFNIQVSPIYKNGDKKANIIFKFKGNLLTRLFFWFNNQIMEIKFLERG